MALVALRQTSAGKQIIDCQPMATVKLISSQTDAKTYFKAVGGKNHTVHLSRSDRTGLRKFLQDPANMEFANCVAVLAHELIHAIHSIDNHDSFKRRNQCDPISREFDNQEEELTITGQTCGIRPTKICENEIRAELRLKPRISH